MTTETTLYCPQRQVWNGDSEIIKFNEMPVKCSELIDTLNDSMHTD